MEHRRLGGSDVEVSVVTFGAWAIGGWLWGPQDASDAVAGIRKALELGVTSIDTAAVYGFGHSEELVAEALDGRKREEVQILTKFGLRWDTDEGSQPFDTTDLAGRPVTVVRNSRPESVMEECERSLRRLKTDYIDVYQCHWPDKDTPVEETFGAVSTLLEQGKILAAGVSNYTVEQMSAARRAAPLASSQPPFSMINRAAERDVIPYCREHNVGVLTYSPLQRGLLTGKITEDYTFAEGDHRAGDRFFQPANVRKVNAFLEQIRPIADAHDATLAQLVIAWTIRRPGVTAALVGARNVRQAGENAAAADVSVTEEEVARIDEHLAALKLEA
jgi:aryl-alcohol dehydrogenase-like predicted oxidoreductase